MTDNDTFERYQRYLEANFDSGCDRFFAPTGFLKEFQRTVDVEAQKQRDVVYFSKPDDAARALEPVISGGEGVFDMSAEPGSGKTSVFPFKFPSKRVVVVEPTPFEAWAAYNMATGKCSLKLKGLSLGPQDAAVTYTDSYLGASMVLSGGAEFDVLMVDECDSDRGCTKFLSEVKAKGKVLVRMSATVGDYGAIKSSSYRVTEIEDMPDIRKGVEPVARYIKEHKSKRNLVLAPSAILAEELASKVPGAVAVTSRTPLSVLARVMVDQSGSGTFIADETCGRGINLNADVEFDCQLVEQNGVMRVLTPVEYKQRKFRVGRNKPGWYRCPGLPTAEAGTSDVDTVRHNVVRAIAGVPQASRKELWVSPSVAGQLMCSPVEPYETFKELAIVDRPVVGSPSSVGGSYVDAFSDNSSDRSTGSSGKSVRVPQWMHAFASLGGNKSEVYVRRDSKGQVSFNRGTLKGSRKSSFSIPDHSTTQLALRTKPTGFVAQDMPYAVARRKQAGPAEVVAVPTAPPVMDLAGAQFDVDWPAIIRDRLMNGGDLPTIVPPGDWKHTSVTGMGSDWFARLDGIAVGDLQLDDNEFEVVCRAWNKLVARQWVKRTPGLSSSGDAQRLEFCVRYFQAFFQLGNA